MKVIIQFQSTINDNNYIGEETSANKSLLRGLESRFSYVGANAQPADRVFMDKL